jgi:predicted RNase H-like nuclease (RuvC/YqgF family)
VSGRRADALRTAAATRSLDATERARGALAQLDRRGQPVTFRAVASEAGVSARFLYGHPELRAAIEQLRAEQQRLRPRPTTRERASEESLRSRLRGMLEENKRLRAENAQLREELALAHGKVRELQLANRRTSTP